MISLSVWEKESFYANKDIVIIGAGLLGLWTALELKQRKPSLSITILERDTVPLGASTRNAGFACFGSPTELIGDAATMGEDNMWKLVELRYKGIQKIRRHFSDDAIRFDECGGYECLLDNNEAVLDNLDWLNKTLQSITGNTNCFVVANEQLPLLGLTGFSSLIQNKSEAALHSGYLVQSLTKKVQEAGAQILYGAPVSSYEHNANTCTIVFNGKTIRAHTLLFCTNAFTQQLLPEANIVPARGQVIVSSPIHNLLLKGTFHFDDGFYYWRNLGDRILLGGARNKAITEEATTALDISTTVQDELERFMQVHLASHYEYNIDHRWAGIMGFSLNKQPMLKRVHGNVFTAMACNGMGVALTPVFAEDAAAAILQNFG